jgi:23S rRNA (uracil1939-C5)-methyltransferase
MVQFYRDKPPVLSAKKTQVTIDSLDTFGQGVSRHQGKPLFVTGALPGETVEVLITEQKRQFARGQVLKLLSESPQRVAAKCQHYQQCGGCQQQHISISLQQQSKSQSLCRLLEQTSAQTIELDTIVAAQPWGYRRRARLSLSWNKQTRQLSMGFRAKASKEMVDISVCPVLEPALEALLIPLRACLGRLRAAATLGHVELIAADNRRLVLLRHTRPLQPGDNSQLQAFAQQYALTLFLDDGENQLQAVGENCQPNYQISGLSLRFSPQDFIQVNRQVNQAMVNLATQWLALSKSDHVLDLFCGMGNFTLPIAKLAGRVTGIEGSETLVQQARENAERQQLSQAEFYWHNLELGFADQPWASAGFTKVLLDPARAGAAGVIAEVAKLHVSLIVYVSCNPATLARDAAVLLAAGYQIIKVAMLDMFPHTSHLESMVLFQRQ